MSLSKSTQNRLHNNYGTWALVTGASSGIGKELALFLAESGFNLVLTGRNEESLNHLKRSIEQKHEAVKINLVIADLEQDAEIQKLIGATKELDLGLFIANAGFGTSGEFIKNSIEKELSLFNVNCKALLVLTHHFGKVFADKRKGGIVLLSSIIAFQGSPYAANYSASKGFVQNLGEALYHELKPYNVDVLCAAPGPVATGFADRAQMNMPGAMSPDAVAKAILEALGNKMTVFPGYLSKLMAFGLKLLPRYFKVLAMKKGMEQMAIK